MLVISYQDCMNTHIYMYMELLMPSCI